MSTRGLKGVTLSDEQRLDWLQLIRSDNIGPRTFRELVNRYGGARGAIDALPALARRGGAPSVKLFPREAAERELAAINVRGARRSGLPGPAANNLRRTAAADDPRRSRGSVEADGRHRRFAQRLATAAAEASYIERDCTYNDSGKLPSPPTNSASGTSIATS